MADKQLICKDCGAGFVFTEGEQQFFAEKGFGSEPARCRDCRMARKADNTSFKPRNSFMGARQRTARYF